MSLEAPDLERRVGQLRTSIQSMFANGWERVDVLNEATQVIATWTDLEPDVRDSLVRQLAEALEEGAA